MNHYSKILSTVLAIAAVAFASNVINGKNVEYKIGDRGPAGGWIFYDKGDTSGGWRYLEAAPENQSDKTQWCNNCKFSHANSENIGKGAENTKLIIKNIGDGKYAAKLCADYRGGGKKDWFMPSYDELNLMYKNLHIQGLGNFVKEGYWSSTEYNTKEAWVQLFTDGSRLKMFKFEDSGLCVRAIRAFK